jgi:flagellar hook-associated protein 2
MSTTIGPAYDPVSTATALAQKYTSAVQTIQTTQSKAATSVEQGLADLQLALTTYQSKLGSLTGLNKTMFAQAATFSDATLGSAVARASAQSGSYAFFVKQLASASQMSYSGLTDDTGVGGTLVVNLGTADSQTGLYPATIKVTLDTADTDKDGKLSTRELAAAINSAGDNKALVTASVISTDSGSELVLTARNTGASSAITLDTTGVTAPADANGKSTSSLANANADPARKHELMAARDAVIHIGSASGTAITQASNSFANIEGVTMTFTRAQAAGEAPVTLTVSADTSATTANVNAFIGAYNTLKAALDRMVDAGDPSKNVAAGVFAHDSGVRALRDRLVSLMRPTGGASLASYGIVASYKMPGVPDGSLILDSERFTRQLAIDPNSLDKLIGSTSLKAPSGIAKELDTFLTSWSSSAKGQIKRRQDENAHLQRDLTSRQALIDTQYNTAYQRFLMQFTNLQALQSQMSSNTSMFDALFGNDKSK